MTMKIECAARHCRNACVGPMDKFCATCWGMLPLATRDAIVKARSMNPTAEATLVNSAKAHLAAT